MNYLLERLKEPSTWRGVILVATGVLGAHWSAESQQYIISAGVGLAGIIGSALPDSWKK